MPYTLMVPENLEEEIRSWNLPPEIAQHLARESTSSRLLEPPFEELQTLSSIANMYRWTVISGEPHWLRLDFKISVDNTNEQLHMLEAKCVRPLGGFLDVESGIEAGQRIDRPR